MFDIAGHCGNASSDATSAVDITRHRLDGATDCALYIDITALCVYVADVAGDGDFRAGIGFKFVDVAVHGDTDFLRVRCYIFAVHDDLPVTDPDIATAGDGDAVDYDGIGHYALLRRFGRNVNGRIKELEICL